jgi:hypothetical protein
MLRAAVGQEAGGATVMDTSSLLEYGADLFPGTLGELVAKVEEMPGVRLEAALRSLVPDEADRGELFDSVVAPLRRNAGIAQGALADYPAERAALFEALNRADAGERSPALLEGLDEASAEILLAFVGMREAEAEEAAASRAKRRREVRLSRFRGGRRARMSREALLDAVRARVAKSIETGASRPVAGRRADAEVGSLIAFAQDSGGTVNPDIEILHAIGWLYWQRFVTSAPDNDDQAHRDQREEAQEVAVTMLGPVFAADPGLVPDPLREAYERGGETEE